MKHIDLGERREPKSLHFLEGYAVQGVTEGHKFVKSFSNHKHLLFSFKESCWETPLAKAYCK